MDDTHSDTNGDTRRAATATDRSERPQAAEAPPRGSFLRRLQPAPLRQSYVAKFALALLVVLATFTTVGLFIVDQTERTLKADVNEQLQTQSHAEAERLEQFLSRFRQPTRLISGQSVFATDNSQQLSVFLERQQDRLSTPVVALHVISVGDKRVVTSTSSYLGEGDDASNFPWITTPSFEQEGLDGVSVSDPYRNENGEKVIAFVSTTNDDPSKLLALVVTIDDISDTFANPIDGGFTQVVDTRGTIIFADDPDRTLQPYLRDDDATAQSLQRAKTGESGVLLDSRREAEHPKELVVAYAPVEGSNWVLVKHAPADNAYRVQRNVTVGVAGFVLIALVGVLALGASFGRRTVRSVTGLAQTARHIEDGDYDVDLSTAREDELGQLYGAIAGMRDELVSRIETAREARQTAERARETLESVNEELENQRLVISLLNRVIRHNLRNDIHVIHAHGDIIQEESEQFAEHGEKVVAHAASLVERSEKAAQMESIVRKGRDARSTIDVPAVVEGEVTAVRSEYPDAHVSTETPARSLFAHAHQDIGVAIEDLVVNAVEHNDTGTATVTVTVTTGADGDSVVVTIDDNGPGIPEPELEVIESGAETERELRQRSGLGLWLAHWLVERSRGTMDVQTDGEDGTRVTITLPSVDVDAADAADANRPVGTPPDGDATASKTD
jgi:signal transduction histidine kinase